MMQMKPEVRESKTFPAYLMIFIYVLHQKHCQHIVIAPIVMVKNMVNMCGYQHHMKVQ